MQEDSFYTVKIKLPCKVNDGIFAILFSTYVKTTWQESQSSAREMTFFVHLPEKLFIPCFHSTLLTERTTSSICFLHFPLLWSHPSLPKTFECICNFSLKVFLQSILIQRITKYITCYLKLRCQSTEAHRSVTWWRDESPGLQFWGMLFLQSVVIYKAFEVQAKQAFFPF